MHMAIAHSTIWMRRKRTNKLLETASTLSQFLRLRQFFADRHRVMLSTTTDPPPGGHSLKSPQIHEILAACLPLPSEVKLQLDMLSIAEIEAKALATRDGHALHELLGKEFKKEYAALFHSVLSLCAVDRWRQTERQYGVCDLVDARQQERLSLADWRHLRLGLDERQLELRNLAAQRLHFPDEASFAKELDDILPPAAIVAEALHERRALARDETRLERNRSAAPVDHFPPPRPAAPPQSRRSVPTAERSPAPFSADDSRADAGPRARTPDPNADASSDLFGKAPASPGLPSAHMDLPDLPDLFDHFSLGARPTLGLRAARHYRTTAAQWAASRRW
ncbi:hypothetical protein BMF94_1120 [Rhodotorula taiwanensis]|uniref:Uncharacterized protein n=1 Tax=Rhodotorula taiwanensis TaxID=741276 RepID=A0A2S5BGB0_9BASI|nr:hypothetical protein BMF94_1120 [Rhodotorula taiwanensis]